MRIDSERREHADACLVQHLAIWSVRLGLDLRFDSDVATRELIAFDPFRQQRQERVGDPPLPVDERAVAVEGDPVDRYERRLAFREAGHALRPVAARPGAKERVDPARATRAVLFHRVLRRLTLCGHFGGASLLECSDSIGLPIARALSSCVRCER